MDLKISSREKSTGVFEVELERGLAFNHKLNRFCVDARFSSLLQYITFRAGQTRKKGQDRYNRYSHVHDRRSLAGN